MDPCGQNLAGSIFSLEQGSAEGKGEVRDRGNLTEGIYAVAERDLKKISKGACHNESAPLLFDFFQNHRFLDLL